MSFENKSSYSVEELEKLVNCYFRTQLRFAMNQKSSSVRADDFVGWKKDNPEKVKEILERD